MGTIVSLHAHPDDEALLTAGTLAQAVSQGHRVVLVTATDGAAGLAASSYGTDHALAVHRLNELQTSADAIGAARTLWLGYADSGLHGDAPAPSAMPVVPTSEPPISEQPSPDQTELRHHTPAHTLVQAVSADLDAVAQQVAAIVTDEHADILTSYDPVGGYGHPDHVAIHQVGRRVMRILAERAADDPASTLPRLMEATVDRDLLVRALRFAARVFPLPPEFDLTTFERSYTPHAHITHRINVGDQIAAKYRAMQAHASQATADDGDRTLAALLRLPMPLYRLVLGREWFVEIPPPALTPR